MPSLESHLIKDIVVYLYIVLSQESDEVVETEVQDKKLEQKVLVKLHKLKETDIRKFKKVHTEESIKPKKYRKDRNENKSSKDASVTNNTKVLLNTETNNKMSEKHEAKKEASEKKELSKSDAIRAASAVDNPPDYPPSDVSMIRMSFLTAALQRTAPIATF